MLLALSIISSLLLVSQTSPGVFAKSCDIGSGKSVEAGIIFEKDCLAKCTCDLSGSGDYNCVSLCPLFGVAHPCRKVRPYQQCCKRSICPDNEQLDACDPFSFNIAKNLTVPWQLRLINGEKSCNGIILSERFMNTVMALIAHPMKA
uniref:Uncharacterized protein n=1 Tax=Romanomermis culicivorax TaxID=13658 RepID=A0A915HZI4_ROMCU